jgi:diphosphomevalonate decarboxylase
LTVAIAHSNIAFIKYWGNVNAKLRLPVNSSLSMNLASLFTRTQINIDSNLKADTAIINGNNIEGKNLTRIQVFLDHVRDLSGKKIFCAISSENNFPSSVGIASSASGFAALACAANTAFNLGLSESALSRLARLGSGSAARSIPQGFVEWIASEKDSESIAYSIAPENHWDLWDCIAIITEKPKSTGSTEGHALAHTSVLQNCRIDDAPRRLSLCKKAILEKDFGTFAEIVEQDSTMMHAVMMTSNPPLYYWSSKSFELMVEIQNWRKSGMPVAFSLDAGPNVHVICTSEVKDTIKEKLERIPGVSRVISSQAGPGAQILD